MLSQLIEELDKPKAPVPFVRTNMSSSNRSSNLHFMHTNSEKTQSEAILESTEKSTLKSQQSDWIQGITPIKMFLNSLNCQKPTPQQINVMNNSKQRLDLFKILQAREHVKFTNIQSEKMLQLH